MRFCDTRTEAGKPAHRECRRDCRSVSPLPYGGSDRAVVLRSLPIGTFHALLLVACTMVFFVMLASARGDDRGVARVNVPLLSPSIVVPGVAGAMGSSNSGGSGAGTLKVCGKNVRTLQTFLAARSVGLLNATACDALATAINSRRDTPDVPRLSATAVSHLLVVIPTVSGRRAVAIKCESYSVRSANLPRLS